MSILKANKLELHINDSYVVQDISFNIEEGESVIVQSSFDEVNELFNLILLKKKFKQGTLFYYDQDLSLYNFRDRIEYTSSDCLLIDNGYDFFDNLNVESNILLPLVLNKKEVKEDYFLNVCETLGIKDILDKNISDLSKYDLVKVKLARAIIVRPFLLLIDNITELLSIDDKKAIMTLINRINDIYKITTIHSVKAQSLTKYGSKIFVFDSGLFNEINA